ncbi:MAG: SCO family protein [Alcaligenaceae bacterium]
MFAATLLSLCALFLSGCNDATPQFKGSDITGTHLGKELALTGTDGKSYTLDTLKGKVTVVLFGFTQCPDICPTSLAELTQVMKLLGEGSKRVQVVLITVDPERDTPEVLRAYVSGFGPQFLGLTGTIEQIKKTAASFKVYYAKTAGANGNYSVDHSASFYLMDAQGESRVLLNNSSGAAAIAHDIQRLLR